MELVYHWYYDKWQLNSLFISQQHSTPEIEVFLLLFARFHTKNREGIIKQHEKYFNFWCKVQLDHPVLPTQIPKLEFRVDEAIRAVVSFNWGWNAMHQGGWISLFLFGLEKFEIQGIKNNVGCIRAAMRKIIPCSIFDLFL